MSRVGGRCEHDATSVKKKAGKLVLALTLLATLAAGYYGWRHWQLSQDGATTTALSVDVDRRRITGKNLTGQPYRYTASYTFADAAGRVRSGRQSIDRSQYEELSNRAGGAPVAVHFSRSNPDINGLGAHSSPMTAIALGLIALFGWGLVVTRGLKG